MDTSPPESSPNVQESSAQISCARPQSVSHQPNQFALLRERRFLPYFLTQLLGAFNDNLFKNALVALIAFTAVSKGASNDTLLINLSAGLFILPFFLFSALSGQIADKYEKSRLIRLIKLGEIGIMLLGAIAFVSGNLVWLLAVLFLMGMQSTFFGPLKYGILPQQLHESELIGGNGLVELGTFLAILVGTIVGTQLIDKAPGNNAMPVAIAIVITAIVGWWVSRSIPEAPAADAHLTIRFNPITETWRLVHDTRRERVVFQAILGISWFWFMGATYIAQFPVYSRDILGGGESADGFTLLLALFAVGIGTGSAICERLSRGRVEIGLVPFGAVGLTVFGFDLFFATPAAPLGSNLGVLEFLAQPGALRVAIDVMLIGFFGGIYIVPLYALIQQSSDPSRLSRAIACNNIMNALFMVISAIVVLILVSLGASIAQLFLAMAIVNALVAAYIFRLVPEFLMRALMWLLIHTIYRVRPQGLSHIPEKGAAVLACNHVSFVDALIIGVCVKRPVRFVMYHKIFAIPVLNFIFKTARAIPIAGAKEDKTIYDTAFVQMQSAVDNGELLCLFPEGEITRDGEFNNFRPGLKKLLDAKPAPVIPMALQGLWGSFFSRSGGRAFFKLPRRLFASIGLVVGPAMAAETLQMDALQQRILELRGERR